MDRTLVIQILTNNCKLWVVDVDNPDEMNCLRLIDLQRRKTIYQDNEGDISSFTPSYENVTLTIKGGIIFDNIIKDSINTTDPSYISFLTDSKDLSINQIFNRDRHMFEDFIDQNIKGKILERQFIDYSDIVCISSGRIKGVSI